MSHHNMLISSARLFCKVNGIELKVSFDHKENLYHGLTLKLNGFNCFLDYQDSPEYLMNPDKYDLYFKRSLIVGNENASFKNVLPLGMQVNYNYQLPLNLFCKGVWSKKNKIEVFRTLDIFGFTNQSHQARNYKRVVNSKIDDNGGIVIYLTRLWNLNNYHAREEIERRTRMNNYRVETCKLLKDHFPNGNIGIFRDKMSEKVVGEDLLVDTKITTARNYLTLLKTSDIGIADDGLKDTLGWKIGEYTLNNLAIVTTPINVVVPGFYNNQHYIETNNRIDSKGVIDIIYELLKGKAYLEMKLKNYVFSRQNMHPYNYFQNIILQIVERSRL